MKMTKEEKEKIINEAIRGSSVAMEQGARAEIIDGRITYSKLFKSSFGTQYRGKIGFMDILSLLHGEEIRRLHQLFGRR